MHELSVTQSIVAIVADHARGRRVELVRLEIGALAAVSPEALKFCFDVCAKGTVADGAELVIDIMEGKALCADCGAKFSICLSDCRCDCGSTNIRCVSGMELIVKEMRVA